MSIFIVCHCITLVTPHNSLLTVQPEQILVLEDWFIEAYSQHKKANIASTIR